MTKDDRIQLRDILIEKFKQLSLMITMKNNRVKILQLWLQYKKQYK